MPTATYKLVVDWANDGSFATAGDDISADVISATIDRGFSSPLARVSMVGRATFILNNSSKSYSPPSQATRLPRRPVRFDMTVSSASATLFRGFIESIEPSAGIYRDRRAVLECVDGMALLDVHEGPLPLLESVTAACVIGAATCAVYVPPGSTLQNGINVFPFSADRWSDTVEQGVGYEEVTASHKIEDACVSDWGSFFISKGGCPTFYNRHQTLLDTTTELALSSSYMGQAYRKSIQDVFNHVEVTCHPRAIGTKNEVLGAISQDTSIYIESSGSLLFSLPFRDPANLYEPVGGKSMITPVATTDYKCTDDSAGAGSDKSASVGVAASMYADHAEVVLTNNSSAEVYVQKLQVRGKAVRVRDPVTMQAVSASSVTTYQRRKMKLDAPLMSSQNEAFRLAEYLMDVHETPRDEVRGVEFSANLNSTALAAARDLELLDRVTLTEDQTGLSDYAGFIYHMTHSIPNQYEHHLTLDLETAFTISGSPFRLDISALNSGHLLVY